MAGWMRAIATLLFAVGLAAGCGSGSDGDASNCSASLRGDSCEQHDAFCTFEVSARTRGWCSCSTTWTCGEDSCPSTQPATGDACPRALQGSSCDYQGGSECACEFVDGRGVFEWKCP